MLYHRGPHITTHVQNAQKTANEKIWIVKKVDFSALWSMKAAVRHSRGREIQEHEHHHELRDTISSLYPSYTSSHDQPVHGNDFKRKCMKCIRWFILRISVYKSHRPFRVGFSSSQISYFLPRLKSSPLFARSISKGESNGCQPLSSGDRDLYQWQWR